MPRNHRYWGAETEVGESPGFNWQQADAAPRGLLLCNPADAGRSARAAPP
jgi:hypothetical protein